MIMPTIPPSRAQQVLPPAATLPGLEVVGEAPAPPERTRRSLPHEVRLPAGQALQAEGLPHALEAASAAVTLGDAQGNPFQPELSFRGFSASPLLGTPQGLAVYQNGVRINETFGDTVHWDLIPEAAIHSVRLAGSNPVYGLNATGGAFGLRMKTGFDQSGTRVALMGGSFGRRSVTLETGQTAAGGRASAYLALEGANDDGWRDRSPSRIRRLHGDIGFRGERAAFHLSVTAGANRLSGNGPTPVELLARDRRAVLTVPDVTSNHLETLQARANWNPAERLRLEGTLYVRRFRQGTVNGDLADLEVCDGGLICLEDGPPLAGPSGRPLEAAQLGGAPPGALNRTRTSSLGGGGSAQMGWSPTVAGRPLRVLLGASHDHGRTSFSGSGELGAVQPDRNVTGLGPILFAPEQGLAPARLVAVNIHTGVFAQAALDITPKLTGTVAARLNMAEVRLRDELGTALDGTHRFQRLNPSAGLTWRLSDGITAHASYAEANRAPTPAELTCADPLRPCALGAFFLSDPPLRQVVSGTWEVGLRGENARPLGLPGTLGWSLGLFRADLRDDILLAQSPLAGRGFFRNGGGTRRQGIEAGLEWRGDTITLRLDTALVDATFRSTQSLPSPHHPLADAMGAIHVRSGDRLPGIPRQRLRLDAEWRPSEQWRLGGTLLVNSGQYLRGDEANLLKPLAGYALLSLRAAVVLWPGAEAQIVVRNALNQRFASFGTLFDVAATDALNLGLKDPRSMTPGQPRAIYAGLRISF